MKPFIIFISIFLYLSNSAYAKSIKTGFFSQKQFFEITIDTNYLITDAKIPKKFHAKSPFSSKTLKDLKLHIIKNSNKLSVSHFIGYPVWFNKKRTSFGIINKDTVIRSDSKNILSIIKKTKNLVSIKEVPFKKGLYIASYKDPKSSLSAANDLYFLKEIKYAHPNFIMPKDFRKKPVLSPLAEPLFSKQWHLENTSQTKGLIGADIKIRAAWNFTIGKPSIKIAIIDGGFEINHPDLINSWHKNPNEIPNDQIDNDKNGYIDDVYGWNIEAQSPDHLNSSYAYHGVAAAGLISASHNGIGVAGVCPNCKMIPITSSLTPIHDAEAFYYAKKMGADIISNSWGYQIGAPITDVVIEAINEVATKGRNGKGTIILFAMNNFDNNDCAGNKPDISSLENVVAISGSTDTDIKSDSTGWGPCMEFIAPTWMYQHRNGGIVTTDMTGDAGLNPKKIPNELSDTSYTLGFSGTSAATPIVAGVFGLVLSLNEKLSRIEAINILKKSADKVHPTKARYDYKTGFSLKYGYGRVNAGKALTLTNKTITSQ